jgi:hypothetical protein
VFLQHVIFLNKTLSIADTQEEKGLEGPQGIRGGCARLDRDRCGEEFRRSSS